MQELLKLKASLEKLANHDLPVKVAFKLGSIIPSLNKEYSAFDESRKKLFDKYCEKKDGKLQVKKENTEAFTNDIDELYDIEVDVKIEKITLEDIKDVKLSAIDAVNLSILIEDK